MTLHVIFVFSMEWRGRLLLAKYYQLREYVLLQVNYMQSETIYNILYITMLIYIINIYKYK